MNPQIDSLIQPIKLLNRVAVAFSGGVDSSLVLALANQALPGKVLALHVTSALHTKAELAEAQALAQQLSVPLQVIELDLLAIPAIQANPPDRCYHCKKAIYAQMLATAAAQNITYLLDGNHAEDSNSYRPGQAAAQEAGVIQPLRLANLDKAQVRALARQLDLPNWHAPAKPCLATRFPYHQPLSLALLNQVAKGESLLADLGFGLCRLRLHGQVARIEVMPAQFSALLNQASEIVAGLKALGFTYITMDLSGFQSGSMDLQGGINV